MNLNGHGNIPNLEAHAHLSRCRDALGAAVAEGVAQGCIVSAPITFPPNVRKGKEGDAARAYLGSAYWEVQLRVLAHGFVMDDGTLEVQEAGLAPDGAAYFALVWTLRHPEGARAVVTMEAKKTG